MLIENNGLTSAEALRMNHWLLFEGVQKPNCKSHEFGFIIMYMWHHHLRDNQYILQRIQGNYKAGSASFIWKQIWQSFHQPELSPSARTAYTLFSQ